MDSYSVTPEEALGIIGHYDVSGFEFFTTDGERIPDEKVMNAFEIGMDAIRKNKIEKEPVEGYVFQGKFREYLIEYGKTDMAQKKGSCCPACGRHIGESEATLRRKNYFPFCHWCGQKLKQAEIIENMPEEDAIPVGWIQEKIDQSYGMESAMWSRLLEKWRKESGEETAQNRTPEGVAEH